MQSFPVGFLVEGVRKPTGGDRQRTVAAAFRCPGPGAQQNSTRFVTYRQFSRMPAQSDPCADWLFLTRYKRAAPARRAGKLWISV